MAAYKGDSLGVNGHDMQRDVRAIKWTQSGTYHVSMWTDDHGMYSSKPRKGSSLPIFMYVALICMTAIWLVAHQIVKRRFAILKTDLAQAYASAVAIQTEDGETPRLIALCIDLMRKEHCTASFETLSPDEQRMALHAYGIATLPGWMSKYAGFTLSLPNRALIAQLRNVHTSRPDKKPVQYFGAIKHQQQLRSASES